jgi:endonuclease YncB( thermonuclease family)
MRMLDRMQPRLLAPILLLLVLAACGGGGGDPGVSSGSGTAASGTLCGYDVGPNLIEGTVSKVHDGDTITVNGASVRLDSIDAPELAQTYGAQAQASLSRLLLGQMVRVAYTKLDQYDRIVGSVFTDSCRYANLEQVAIGSAWFYRAYQCEVSAATRLELDRAESSAKAARLGLWAEDSPIAPWVYRNGNNPEIPNCR